MASNPKNNDENVENVDFDALFDDEEIATWENFDDEGNILTMNDPCGGGK